jgi:hypothetical protein
MKDGPGRASGLAPYAISSALILLVMWISSAQGDSTALILLKALVVPLWYLAERGIQATFTSDAARTPFTIVFLERAFLRALALSAAVQVVLYSEDTTASRAISTFLITLSVSFAGYLLLDPHRR